MTDADEVGDVGVVGKCVTASNAADTADSVVVNCARRFSADPEHFHGRLAVRSLRDADEVERHYAENARTLREPYGILLFLYSVIATRVGWIGVFRG